MGFKAGFAWGSKLDLKQVIEQGAARILAYLALLHLATSPSNPPNSHTTIPFASQISTMKHGFMEVTWFHPAFGV